MDKQFEKFLKLVEEAGAALPEEEYFRLLDRICGFAGDTVFEGRMRTMRRLEAESDRLAEERVALCGA